MMNKITFSDHESNPSRGYGPTLAEPVAFIDIPHTPLSIPFLYSIPSTMNDGIANIFTIQMVLAAPIITIGLTMLLFGFYAPLFGQSFYFLSTRQCAINRRLHLTSITSLFLVAATASFVGAAGVIQDSISMVRALQTRDPEPSRAVFDLITPGRIGLEAINQIGFVVTNCIADYVLIYRLYTIWGSSKRVIALPLVASLVANALSFAFKITRVVALSGFTKSLNAIKLYDKTVTKFPVVYYSVVTAANGMITLMIAGRIWWVARDSRRGLSGRLQTQSHAINEQYKTIIAMVLESGVMYPTILTIQVILLSAGINYVDLTPPVILVAGIAPTFVILRSNFNRFVQEGLIGDKDVSLHLGSTLVRQES